MTGSYGVGTSVLYLIDTEKKQLLVYEARGGSQSMRRIVLVGARRIDLAAITRAAVEAQWSDDGARLTRLVLDTDQGRVPLEYGYGPTDRRALEDAVNEWLTRPG